MKKFIKKILLLMFLSIIFIESMCYLFLVTDLYLFNYSGQEVYRSIFKSKQKNKAKVLVLGDSVGYQLFPNNRCIDKINSLACNQSIGMSGHFLLLNNYLNSGNKIDYVYLVYRPFSFKNNLDQVYTYHYFLKPFNLPEYIDLFTETVKKQIEKIPYRKFCRIPHILATSWAPNFVSEDKNDFTFLSPISVEYIKKIVELSIKHKFKFFILPAPLSSETKGLLDKINKNEISTHKLENEFKDYFKNLVILDDSLFWEGGIHLREPDKFSEKYKNMLNFQYENKSK